LDLVVVPTVLWGSWAVVTPLVFALARRLASPRLGARGILLLVATSLPAVALHTAAHVGVVTVLQGGTGGRSPLLFYSDVLRRFVVSDLFVYAAAVTLCIAVTYRDQASQRLVQASRLEAQLARARLEALEAHLHPHFLFNMLHSISALLDVDVREARRMIARFGELLRMTLDARATPEVPLAWEVDFVERYLAIQRIRFPDRMAVEHRVAPDVRDALVPRLLLQPLVENAIRHGVERSDGLITITVWAARQGDRLLAGVDDTGPGLPDSIGARGGIGLSTTRARLREAYGEDATLTVQARPGGGLSVAVSLPLLAHPVHLHDTTLVERVR
jgi:LytS/YehU family sensor histidine kinase